MLEVDRLFERFIRERHQIMLVVSELGSVAGVVSLEDVVETILGVEIMDEQDKVANLRSYARKLWRERAAKMGLGTDDPGGVSVEEEP